MIKWRVILKNLFHKHEWEYWGESDCPQGHELWLKCKHCSKEKRIVYKKPIAKW